MVERDEEYCRNMTDAVEILLRYQDCRGKKLEKEDPHPGVCHVCQQEFVEIGPKGIDNDPNTVVKQLGKEQQLNKYRPEMLKVENCFLPEESNLDANQLIKTVRRLEAIDIHIAEKDKEISFLTTELEKYKEREHKLNIEIQASKTELAHRSKLSKAKIKYLVKKIKDLKKQEKKSDAILLTVPKMQKSIIDLTAENSRLKKTKLSKEKDRDKKREVKNATHEGKAITEQRLRFIRRCLAGPNAELKIKEMIANEQIIDGEGNAKYTIHDMKKRKAQDEEKCRLKGYLYKQNWEKSLLNKMQLLQCEEDETRHGGKRDGNNNYINGTDTIIHDTNVTRNNSWKSSTNEQLKQNKIARVFKLKGNPEVSSKLKAGKDKNMLTRMDGFQREKGKAECNLIEYDSEERAKRTLEGNMGKDLPHTFLTEAHDDIDDTEERNITGDCVSMDHIVKSMEKSEHLLKEIKSVIDQISSPEIRLNTRNRNNGQPRNSQDKESHFKRKLEFREQLKNPLIGNHKGNFNVASNRRNANFKKHTSKPSRRLGSSIKVADTQKHSRYEKHSRYGAYAAYGTLEQ